MIVKKLNTIIMVIVTSIAIDVCSVVTGIFHIVPVQSVRTRHQILVSHITLVVLRTVGGMGEEGYLFGWIGTLRIRSPNWAVCIKNLIE